MKSATFVLCLIIFVSCAQPENDSFKLFFERLAEQCGYAFPGSLTLEPEGRF
jgi:hypothetical protein